jgi:hypothetical protein
MFATASSLFKRGSSGVRSFNNLVAGAITTQVNVAVGSSSIASAFVHFEAARMTSTVERKEEGALFFQRYGADDPGSLKVYKRTSNRYLSEFLSEAQTSNGRCARVQALNTG